MNMSRLESIVHSFLLKLPPETSHSLGLRLMRMMPRVEPFLDDALKINTKFGVLNNPIGLAAGFDKTGKYIRHLEKLGFGYLIAGTVTRNPRKGNRKPRIIRKVDQLAIINSMGFPNPGITQFLKNVRENRSRATPLIISVSDELPDNLLECYKLAQVEAAAIEINISSPNTPALRHYFELELFKDLIDRLREHKTKPTYLKLPPISSTDEKDIVTKMIKAWHDAGFEGVTVVNTLAVQEPRLSTGMGGMSGRPLFKYMIENVKLVRGLTDGSIEINAVGGIFTGQDALLAIMYGATSVQIYTALVYRGALSALTIARELLTELRKAGFYSLSEARGTALGR